VISIVGNAIVLAMDKYPIDRDIEYKLETLNLTFFSIFAFELIVKLSAFGMKFYYRDKFNWFDSLVVLFSAIDVTLTYTNISKSF